jgi:hypothetical protein
VVKALYDLAAQAVGYLQLTAGQHYVVHKRVSDGAHFVVSSRCNVRELTVVVCAPAAVTLLSSNRLVRRMHDRLRGVRTVSRLLHRAVGNATADTANC